MVHERVGCFDGGVGNPLDTVRRRTSLYSCVQQHLGRSCRTVLCGRMKAENNWVTRLERNNGLEHGGGGRICNGRYACNHADWLGNLFIPLQLIFFNHTCGFHGFDGMVDVFSRKHIFGNFIFIYAASSFFHCHFCQRHVLIHARHGHGLDNGVHLFLIHSAHGLQCMQCVFYQCIHFRLHRYGVLLVFCHFCSILSCPAARESPSSLFLMLVLTDRADFNR